MSVGQDQLDSDGPGPLDPIQIIVGSPTRRTRSPNRNLRPEQSDLKYFRHCRERGGAKHSPACALNRKESTWNMTNDSTKTRKSRKTWMRAVNRQSWYPHEWPVEMAWHKNNHQTSKITVKLSRNPSKLPSVHDTTPYEIQMVCS